MIYVPDLTNYKCFYVQSEGVIRAYEEIPTNNSSINYRDYFVNSSYLYKDGVQIFNNYSTLPICLTSAVLTDKVEYRIDFDSILIIFLIMCIFCFYIPICLFKRIFRRVG